MKLKTFESWLPGDKVPTNDNSKVWIIGIPSGEAFQVTREELNTLHKEKTLYYTTKYCDIGFYAFDDENVELVKKYVDPKKSNPAIKQKDKEQIILRNDFSKTLIELVKEIIQNYQTFSELYVQDDIIGITYDNDFYLEVTKLDNGYNFVKRQKGIKLDEYFLKNGRIPHVTDTSIARTIEDEMYDIWY